jgi:ATP-binding cassette subfamily B protein
LPLRRIAGLLAPYRIRLGGTLGLIAMSSILGLVPPLLLRGIVDVALPQGRIGLLTLLAVVMIAVSAAGSCAGVAQAYLSLGVGQAVLNDLRIAVYARLQKMSLAFFTRTHTGEIQSRIANDVDGMAGTLTVLCPSIVSNATVVLANLAAMLTLDWKLTVLSLLMLPVFVAISRKVGDMRQKITRERQQQMARLTVRIEESLSVSGFLLGRTMGRTSVLTREFAEQSEVLKALTMRSAMAGRWRASIMQIIMSAMPIVVYWAAGVTSSHGRPTMTIGTLVAFASLQQGLFGPSVQLLQVGITLRGSMPLFERTFEYLDLPIAMPEPLRPIPLPRARGHVRLENVGFSHGDHQVLRNISIDIPAGSHVAVVGATGAGKTSLGYLVPRLYDVSAGRVTIDGVDVQDLSFETLADVVGVVSQETYLFHASIADNLRFAKPDATDEELVEAARIAQIHDLIASLPDGYRTTVGERGYRFSGGEKQRLTIARVVLRDPRVLVLDEATSALDVRTERSLQQALDLLSVGRTTITIAHRLSTVAAADWIVVLSEGRIVEQGTPQALQARGGHYAALLAKTGEPNLATHVPAG